MSQAFLSNINYYIAKTENRLFNQTNIIMSFLYFILVGALAGWLVGTLFKGGGFGLLGNIVVGIVGGVLGGWVFGLLGISTDGGLLGSIITAVVGGGLLVWIVGMFKK